MSLIDFLPGAYGALAGVTARGLYPAMMRWNMDTYHVDKWCRYHGTHASDWGSNQCCGTRKENQRPFRPWFVALVALVISVCWPLVWTLGLIMFDPRKSKMRYLGQDRNGTRVSVSANATADTIAKPEKELGIGNG